MLDRAWCLVADARLRLQVFPKASGCSAFIPRKSKDNPRKSTVFAEILTRSPLSSGIVERTCWEHPDLGWDTDEDHETVSSRWFWAIS